MNLNRTYIWILIFFIFASCNNKPVDVVIGNRVNFYMCSIVYKVVIQSNDSQVAEFVERFYHCGEMVPEPISGRLAKFIVEQSVEKEIDAVRVLAGKIDRIDSLRARVMLDWKHDKVFNTVIWHGASLELEHHFWVSIADLKKEDEGSFALE